MKTKFLGSLLVLSLALVACDKGSTSSTSNELYSDNTSVEVSANSETASIDKRESDVSEALKDSKAATTSEKSGQAKPSTNGSSSKSDKAETKVKFVKGQKIDNELLKEVIRLIHEATDEMYKSEDFYFLPTMKEDENLLQVELYRQSPEGQDQQNLIALYKYNKDEKKLYQLDQITGELKDVTPEKKDSSTN